MSLKRKKREIVESVPPDYWRKFGGEDGREAAGALVAHVKRDPWLQGRRAQWWLAWMEGKLRTMTSDRLRWVLDEVVKLVRPSLIRTALTAYEERQADFESRRRQNPQVRPSASASNPEATDSDPEVEFIVKVALAAVPLMTTSKNEGRRDRGRDRRKKNAGAPAGAPTS